MCIKEIIRITALLLGRDNVIRYLDGDTDEQNVGADCLRTINVLTDLTNLVINELSTTYIPMTKVEKVVSNDGKVYYKDLTERILRVRAVYDIDGKNVEYSVNSEYVKVNYSEVEIEYDFVPENYGLEQTIGYTDKDVSARVIANGVASEFNVSEGRFDEAVTFHKRYVDMLSDICLPKNTFIKKRRWA